MHTNRIAQIRSLVFGTGLAVGLLFMSAAQAHVALVASTPAANAVVAPPKQIDLVFNERLVPRASRLELSVLRNGEVAGNIERMAIEFVHDGKTLRANLHQPLGAGVYRVRWRAVGTDKHPMTGEFRFTVQ